jgi:hypothetical protein
MPSPSSLDVAHDAQIAHRDHRHFRIEHVGEHLPGARDAQVDRFERCTRRVADSAGLGQRSRHQTPPG